MVFTHTITGATNRSSVFRGDVGLVSGTWTSTNGTAGIIETGGSTILAHNVTVGSASDSGTGTLAVYGGSASILSFKNKDVNGDGLPGHIQVKEIDNSNIASGDWWAVVLV